MGAARVLLLVMVGLLAAGCGGGDEPSSDDVATIKVMLRSGADVQRVVQPIFLGLPEEPECYRQVGPEIVEVVERERKAVDAALAETDDACLREAVSLYGDSLERYTEAGRAAVEGDTAAADAAISKTTALEIAYTQKIGECGFAQGPTAELTTRMRLVSVEFLRLNEEMFACPDEPCVLDVAARLETSAVEGGSILDEMVAKLGEEDVPPCLPRVLQDVREAYRAVELAARALQERDADTAIREGTRAGELDAAAQEDMAACLSSAGL